MPAELSLIMPFFNAERFLAEALLSLQAQTYSNWELIAIDDFSEDDSLAILQKFAAEDARIKIIQNLEKGIIPALKLAFEHCEGQYISRCDADDIYPNERFAMMIERIKARAPKTVITGMVSYVSDKSVSRQFRKHEAWLNEINICGATWSNVYRSCVIASPNWLCSKADLQAIDAFKNLEYPENYDLVFQWYKHGFEVECIGEISLYWREHPLRISRLSEDYQQKAFFLLKIKRFLEIEKFTKLYLLGKGKKAKICASLLIEKGIDFNWINLKSDITVKKKETQVEDFRYADLSNGAKLLIDVYHNPAQIRSIEDFLMSQNKIEGKDYWYI